MYQSLSHLYEIFLHDSQGFKFQWKRVKQLSTETPRGIADGKTCLFNLFKTTADVHLKTSILQYACNVARVEIQTCIDGIIVWCHALIIADSYQNAISS